MDNVVYIYKVKCLTDDKNKLYQIKVQERIGNSVSEIWYPFGTKKMREDAMKEIIKLLIKKKDDMKNNQQCSLSCFTISYNPPFEYDAIVSLLDKSKKSKGYERYISLTPEEIEAFETLLYNNP
ncbi:hypothetical protein BEH94_11385 [Candidatus Altiarchaeales archaeon WOR_SM1_SCG]|nr:hypothetical protein BEH94_11385 [Candidatus Altiarchaeales archaeon WOR_SM1_SCG]